MVVLAYLYEKKMLQISYFIKIFSVKNIFLLNKIYFLDFNQIKAVISTLVLN